MVTAVFLVFTLILSLRGLSILVRFHAIFTKGDNFYKFCLLSPTLCTLEVWFTFLDPYWQRRQKPCLTELPTLQVYLFHSNTFISNHKFWSPKVLKIEIKLWMFYSEVRKIIPKRIDCSAEDVKITPQLHYDIVVGGPKQKLF